jgi:antitoxin PrlF
MTATITSKGQITIPQAIRDELGLKPGQKLDFKLTADRKLQVEVAEEVTVESLSKILPPSKIRLSVEEMNDAIGRAICDARTGH